VLPPSPGAVLLAALLAGAAQAAEPPPVPRCAATARFDLAAGSEDKARLLAEREEPGGLLGAVWLEGAGVVAPKDVGWEVRGPPANALGLEVAWSYSYTPTGESRPASVAVRLGLLNPGAEPWTLAGAALVDSTGEQVELARWPLAPIPANGAGAVVVGLKGERAQLGCPCTLKLWEAQGPRTVTLENVTFPEGKAKGP